MARSFGAEVMARACSVADSAGEVPLGAEVRADFAAEVALASARRCGFAAGGAFAAGCSEDFAAEAPLAAGFSSDFGAENSQANWQMTGGASPLDGRSSHSTTPREPCVGVGDGTDEASVAVRVGRVSSVEREMIWSAETLRRVEGNTGCDVRVRSSRAPRRLRPLARMYVICRDLGDLRVALVGRHQGRKGKADSRSRRCTTRRSLTRA